MTKPRKFWSIIIVLCLVFVVQLCSLGSAKAAIADWTQEQKFFNNVWQIVYRSYVDDSFNHQNWYRVRKSFANRKFNSREETYAAIQEMLASLGDPFTRFLPPDQYRTMQTSTSGALTGVGLQIAIDPQTNSPIVIAPIEGSPADKAGVRSLDRILKIDNVSTDNLTLDECAERMRGQIGTQVTLSIARTEYAPETSAKKDKQTPKQKTFDVEIRRDRIEVNPIVAKLDDFNHHKIGYIRLSQFNGNAATEMASTIKRMEAKGTDAYVLDLRGNPGGLLQAGIEIARMWLPDGTIVYTADRMGIQESFTAHGQALTKHPLVILQDSGTASASEILAGALQDNGRASLVGTKTYGKGLIQSLFELEDGSGLAVTIAKYETPSHRDINKVGITPDLEVKISPISREQLATQDDIQYQTAIKLLDRQISHPQTTPAVAKATASG
ncbi:S41 family peptidase [Pseudanabaena sp. PCC 6802]|uniref:S41 family peptidase n=1 Tax=Pseudanabaena sp. PCC 6802 TaxID=118173 RepID=UPI00034836E1|nr:S41 family peptidase [Pseudanabaena sp. PCC 6802]